MEPFVTHAGRAVPLRRSNVDTDQIIPAEYLKQVSRTGFGKGLFAAWREDPSFVLNQPQYEGATILVAGKDFGTGSFLLWPILNLGKDIDKSWSDAPLFRVFLAGAILFCLGWAVRHVATSNKAVNSR